MKEVINPSPKSYLIFSVLLMPFIVVFLLGFVSANDYGSLIIAIFFGISLCLLFVWISWHRIELYNGVISVGRFNILNQSVKRDEILEWYTHMGFRDHKGRTGPFFRLVIEMKSTCDRDAIILPLKIFNPSDIRKLINFIEAK